MEAPELTLTKFQCRTNYLKIHWTSTAHHFFNKSNQQTTCFFEPALLSRSHQELLTPSTNARIREKPPMKKKITIAATTLLKHSIKASKMKNVNFGVLSHVPEQSPQRRTLGKCRTFWELCYRSLLWAAAQPSHGFVIIEVEYLELSLWLMHHPWKGWIAAHNSPLIGINTNMHDL